VSATICERGTERERLSLSTLRLVGKLAAPQFPSRRFLVDALEKDPKLGDDRRAQHRYNAADYALLIAAGRGKDATPLKDAARADLRRRALAWLKAELAAWSKVLETGSPRDRSNVIATIRWWPRDPDLATVRDADALTKLPEAERKEWQAIWAQVDALIRETGDAKPR
jgi:hypothetical protein